jgi:hypothetical protein
MVSILLGMETHTMLYLSQSITGVHDHIRIMESAGWAVRSVQRHKDAYDVVDWLVVYERERP